MKPEQTEVAGLAIAPAEIVINPPDWMRYTPGLTPAQHAGNIARLADMTAKSGQAYALSMLLAGEYCRGVKEELKLRGDAGWRKWLATAVPGVSANALCVAMDVAARVFAKNEALFDMPVERKVEVLSEVVGDRAWPEFARAEGVLRTRPAAPGANVDPATGKRINFPSKKTPAEKVEEKPNLMAGHWLAALETLERETTQGGFALLGDDEAEVAYGRLRDLAQALLDTVLLPRRRAKETALPGAKIRKP